MTDTNHKHPEDGVTARRFWAELAGGLILCAFVAAMIAEAIIGWTRG